jgi:hypothetical protein
MVADIPFVDPLEAGPKVLAKACAMRGDWESKAGKRRDRNTP